MAVSLFFDGERRTDAHFTFFLVWGNECKRDRIGSPSRGRVPQNSVGSPFTAENPPGGYI